MQQASVATTRPALRATAQQTPNRHEVLRGALLSTIDLLSQRRAHQIDESYIDNYVALGWLEWHGGSLRLTSLGSSVCQQMTERLAAAAN